MTNEDFEQVVARLGEIETEIRELADLEELDEDQETRWVDINREFDELNEKREKHLERQAAIERVRVAASDPRNVIHGVAQSGELPDLPMADPKQAESRTFDLNTIDGERNVRSRALNAVEEARGFTDRDREVVTGWLEGGFGDGTSRVGDALARHIVVTSSPTYTKAFMSALRTGLQFGQANPNDVQTLAGLQAYTFERAMSLTDASGGFAIPQQLDPVLILTSDGTANSIRQVSRVVQATGDVWSGLSTTHASWSNDAEAAEVSDDATTFAQPTVTIHKQQVFIPFSIEIQGDYPGFEADLRLVIARGKDDLDATNFTTGTGSGQPFGIVTAIDGTANDIGSATTDVFALEDVYALDETIAAKYRRRATWHAHRAIFNDIRQFDTSGGAALWERLAGDVPPRLLGKPAYENEAMDGVIDALAENNVLVFGDFSNYVIADRVGMTLELVPHLFATGANRPSGQRGLYGWARGGADSVNDAAFALLNVT